MTLYAIFPKTKTDYALMPASQRDVLWMAINQYMVRTNLIKDKELYEAILNPMAITIGSNVESFISGIQNNIPMLSEFIMQSFHWSGTKQGNSFWSTIHTRLEYMKTTLNDIPIIESTEIKKKIKL